MLSPPAHFAAGGRLAQTPWYDLTLFGYGIGYVAYSFWKDRQGGGNQGGGNQAGGQQGQGGQGQGGQQQQFFEETPGLSHKGGLTALLHAARQGHLAAATALLDGGADVNVVSAGDGTSPLLMATINGQFDMAMPDFSGGFFHAISPGGLSRNRHMLHFRACQRKACAKISDRPTIHG